MKWRIIAIVGFIVCSIGYGTTMYQLGSLKAAKERTLWLTPSGVDCIYHGRRWAPKAAYANTDLPSIVYICDVFDSWNADNLKGEAK